MRVVPADTIYLPALKMLQDDYQTTEDLATASVAIYMFMVSADTGWLSNMAPLPLRTASNAFKNSEQ